MQHTITILTILLVLYLFTIRGRRGNPAMAELRKWKFAHRGLHDEKLPENSMGAFRAALENGYGIELDVHLLADGNLAVIHDSTLKRVTGAEGIVEDLVTEDLKNYHLGGTEETIPTFRELLDLYEGKAPLIVELKPMLGFDQRSPHHAYDLFTHVAHVVAGVPAELALRWAALLHDIGKVPTFTQDETGRGHFYGHAPKGAEMAEEVLLRLKAPTALRQQVVLLIEKHMTRLQPDKKQLRRQIGRLGWETVEQILLLQEADMGSKGTGESDDPALFAAIRQVMEEIRQEDSCLSLKELAVKGNDLMALGFSGRAIGQMLNALLEQVLEENLPNDRETLLSWAEGESHG